MIFEVKKLEQRQVYNLLIGLVAPRPIALVTSMNEQGQLNAAPFSAYNYLCTDPPVVGLGVTDKPGGGFVPKDTARNIRRGGEFVVNVVTEDLAKAMNVCATDFPADVNELEMAGLGTRRSSAWSMRRSRSGVRASFSDVWSPCSWRIGLSIRRGPTCDPRSFMRSVG